jgi:Clp amino terminal domain, pathogenicity island component
MFERFDADARAVVVHAQQHARRLGHRYIGCEHLLLAAVATAAPAGTVLRGHGLEPERVEAEIVSRVGLGAMAALFADLDRDALARVGVDLDAVRARIEASVPADVLTRAGQAMLCRPRRRRHNRRPRMLRRWRRWRRARRGRTTSAGTTITPPAATGHYRTTPGSLPTGHLPFTPAAKRILELSLREALARHDQHIGVEHIVLSLLAINTGPVPPILTALGTSAPALRTAIIDRYREAS